MAATITATRQVVEDYQRLFVNRRAYTMQSLRPHPETGRHYYFRPSKKGTDMPLVLTDETIRRHLEGEITVGLYAINPSTQRCKWVAIDADYKNAMEDLLKLQYHLSQDRVEAALEMSKRGGHLWILLAMPLLAKECRIYIHDLALRLGVPVKGAGLADGIEVFPKHDAIGSGEFGTGRVLHSADGRCRVLHSKLRPYSTLSAAVGRAGLTPGSTTRCVLDSRQGRRHAPRAGGPKFNDGRFTHKVGGGKGNRCRVCTARGTGAGTRINSGEWCREVLLAQLAPSLATVPEKAILSEVLGLRMIVINLLRELGSGGLLTTDKTETVIDWADRQKVTTAVECLREYAARNKP